MSLTRILEPEIMDSPQDALEYDSMDHGEVNRRFVDDLLDATTQLGDVLDLGTGTAQIPIELVRRGAACRVMALDAAVSMLELARYNIEVAGCITQIQLTHGDGKQLGFPDEMFDTVMSNSIVHHIPEPSMVFHEAVRVTKAGGTLFFRDLLRPASKMELDQLVSLYAGSASDYQRQLFAASLHAALSLEEVREMIVGLGFAADSVRATSDRHWTWSAQKIANDSGR